MDLDGVGDNSVDDVHAFSVRVQSTIHAVL